MLAVGTSGHKGGGCGEACCWPPLLDELELLARARLGTTPEQRHNHGQRHDRKQKMDATRWRRRWEKRIVCHLRSSSAWRQL